MSHLDRRSFLASIAAIGGSLVLGFEIPFGTRATHASVGPREITAWIVIEPDETVIIRVAKSEMGQGSFTALPMLVAEELECDWSKVRAEFAPPHENRKRNRVWGNMSTGTSRSISASQNDLRRAGATARAMLIAAAAARWNVPMTECTAAQGVISHGPSGRSVTFGAIAAAAADMNAPTQVALKDPKDWKLIGTRQRRFDVPDKITGKPIWWLVLAFIPIVNIVFIVLFCLVCIEIAKGFGKGTGFGVGLALLGFVFWPIVGFGDATWQGISAAPGGFPVTPGTPAQ